MVNLDPENECSACEQLEIEVSNHYIGEEHATLSPLEWWQENKVRYPLLAQLASGYLAVPATSVPCERAFSMAGHVTVNQNRACLLPSNVNMLVFLAENLD